MCAQSPLFRFAIVRKLSKYRFLRTLRILRAGGSGFSAEPPTAREPHSFGGPTATLKITRTCARTLRSLCATTFCAHASRLRTASMRDVRTFQICARAHVSANLTQKKCRLGLSEIEYVRRVINIKGITMRNETITRVLILPLPISSNHLMV